MSILGVNIVNLVTVGGSAFVATNIDDIFMLMLFLSSLTFPTRQVILGQYIGIGSLVAISAVGSLISLVVPIYVIGLLVTNDNWNKKKYLRSERNLLPVKDK